MADKPVIFNRAAAKEIARAVRKPRRNDVRDVPGVRIPNRSGGSSGILRCIITTAGFAGTGGPVVGVKLSASDGSAFGSEFYCIPMGHRAVGEYLYAFQTDNTGVSYNPGSGVIDIRWVETGARGMTFAVALTQTGGSAGSQSTKCTFSYTVKDAAGSITLGTGLNPENQADYDNGKRKAATKGQAYIHTDGTIKFFCEENPTTGAC